MGGTSTAMAKRILAGMSYEQPTPLPRLAEKLQMSESNLRRALHDIEDLDLVVQLPLPKPLKKSNATPHTKSCQFGWKKCRILGSEKLNTTEEIQC